MDCRLSMVSNLMFYTQSTRWIVEPSVRAKHLKLTWGWDGVGVCPGVGVGG